LRGKLGEHDRMISTVRNVGYRLEHDADVVVVE
jgi:DNA-binding response OmpR family regulator